MELLIVTGMSGAGKSQTANVLEDIGYYCVDNIPPLVIPYFIDVFSKKESLFSKIAIITDIRGGELFDDIISVLDELKEKGVPYKILFLDSAKETLIKRYKENRRKHPLCTLDNLTVSQAVEKESLLLNHIKQKSDYVIDTTHLSISQLKQHLLSTFLKDGDDSLEVLCVSFGFKYGIPSDADLVFDVRCLPNPFYIDSMRNRTGLEQDIQDFVMNSSDSTTLLQKTEELLDFLLPLYRKEGKSQLTVAIGCTGGKHRSVTFAEKINRHLAEHGAVSSAFHRDISKQ